ncbi:hypothetical protein AURDEDRAFT_174474 [Auricularia subglabra TFB-10046 SS5]|uniref:F-box domain-containing protein n=1 Tax=Auricularia subglabra (strain TFB-10046 / SS5) TaxID=717982 RepID=J0CYN5_AURST|nr:hypothetical protein AURDEDRAFT_174474 [Auricularia subglabra TFB-10046 SS5]
MAFECASCSPFRIPPELLCEIFRLLSFRDRVQSTHVCKYWRSAALDHPRALWSIIYSHGLRTGALGDQLARTRGVLVDVAVLLKDSTLDEAMSAISTHLHHIRSLVLYSANLGEGEVSMSNIHYLYEYLAHPAPMLEELDIALAIDDTHPDDFNMRDPCQRRMRSRILSFDYALNADLFAGDAPRLRQAAWLVMELNPDGCAALRGLRRLAFESRRLSSAHVDAIINCLPQLKCLLIEVTDIEGLPNPPRPAAFQLDELYLSIPEHGSRAREQDIIPVLEYLGYRNISRVATYRFLGWLECFTAPPRSLPRILHLDAVGGLPYWHMVDANGFVSQALYLFTRDLLDTPLGIRLLENLETLVIEASLVYRLGGRALLPRLSHISIRFRDTTAAKIRPEPSLHCPSLQSMDIWWDTEQPREPGIISQCLAYCLKSVAYTPRPPLHVTIRGAGLTRLTNDDPTFTLTFSSEPVPESFIVERSTRWHVLDTE